MDRLAWIALGGAAGTLARYGIGIWCHQRLGVTFPYGTLMVNLGGSFLLAVIMQAALTTSWVSETMRLGLTTGLMGGFTTYSTFNYETTQLFEQGAWRTAVLNVVVTVLGCLLAGAAGAALAKTVVSR